MIFLRTISAISAASMLASGIAVTGPARASEANEPVSNVAATPGAGLPPDASQNVVEPRATSARSTLAVSNFRLTRSARHVSGTVRWDRNLLGKKNRFTVNLMAFTATSGPNPVKIKGREAANMRWSRQSVRFTLGAKQAAKVRNSRVLVLTATQQRGTAKKGAYDRTVAASAYLADSTRSGGVTHLTRTPEPRFLGAVFTVVALVGAGIEIGKSIKKSAKKKPKVVKPKAKASSSVSVGANFKGAQVKGANLSGSVLPGANFKNADMRGVDIKKTNLKGADLRGANLAGADLRGIDLTGADLTGANLAGANLEGAILTGVKGAVLPQHIVFNPIPNTDLSVGTLSLTASGGGSGKPVTFKSLTNSVCTTGGTNGATVTLLAEGTCTIQADQARGSGYLAAQPAVRSFAVTTSDSCASGGTCEPGDVGPGGGLVFYVDYQRPVGSQVFEAAPNGWSGSGADPTANFGCSGTAIPGAADGELGSGEASTAAIIAACPTEGIAARIAAAYTGGSQADWYLPSYREITALCLRLYSEPASTPFCPQEADLPAGYSAGPYQTSTQNSAVHGMVLYFPANGVVNVVARDYDTPVRPIRSF